MHIQYLELLRCPQTGSQLTLEVLQRDGDFIKEGFLLSSSGIKYPIIEYIPRFSGEAYSASFSVEWEKHPDILIQSSSNLTAYHDRFFNETGWSTDLNGELILEAGCGPGSFTPIAMKTGARIVSLDLSQSVEIAWKNSGYNCEKVLFIQASVLNMPFSSGTFDKAFCFGVLQHTPDPEGAFYNIVETLKPGGALAVDSYVKPDPVAGGAHRLLRAKYRIRNLLKKLSPVSPRRLHRYISIYVDAVWSITRLLEKFPGGKEINRTLLIDDYMTRLKNLNVSRHKEFAVLDIFDFLSPVYDEPQTMNSFKNWFLKAGLEKIDVAAGYNGLEGRAIKQDH